MILQELADSEEILDFREEYPGFPEDFPGAVYSVRRDSAGNASVEDYPDNTPEQGFGTFVEASSGWHKFRDYFASERIHCPASGRGSAESSRADTDSMKCGVQWTDCYKDSC